MAAVIVLIFTEQRALFVKDCLELIFRSCLVSPLNAEELVFESGMTVLYSIFDFYKSILIIAILNDLLFKFK